MIYYGYLIYYINCGNKQRGPGRPKKMARREEVCELDDNSDESVVDDPNNIKTKKIAIREEFEEDVDVEETVLRTRLQLLVHYQSSP
ncbi:hypothetical protein BpHYR1_000976 [Brachionus plicatilis]|uniref:Uncharacterized protein n=1 Tax=Brachionus plicatilis TaxID=10195 RepID=A0A3M7T3D8_BRAPC|nr:hypothetical protein BpHYR1_000976 [Brachionus plicatilis]